MKTVLITGGAGDWASSFKSNYSSEFNILTPGRAELDVTNEAMVESYIDQNRIDVLINNAGSIHPKKILQSDSKLWINDINVNLVGTYLAAKYVLKSNSEALIINISSTAGFNAYADWSSYCASKAAVITLSKSLANDGFKSYCLCPGGFDTKFRDNFDLNNDNLMPCSEISRHVMGVIDSQYKPGDVLFFRKGEFKLNP